jgi:shikimate kinase
MNFHGPIVIIGFMACGKTEVARVVANELKLKLVDLDAEITSVEGRSPAELIREEGESAFRNIETASLQRALAHSDANVIALGGGAWIQPANRQLLAAKKAIVVWLDTPFEICWARIQGASEDRPLGTTREQATQLFKQRYPIYELAAIRIDVTAADTPAETAIRVLDRLRHDPQGLQ